MTSVAARWMIGAGAAGMAVFGGVAMAGEGPARVGYMVLEGALHEQPSPIAWLLGSGGHVTLSEAVGAIRKAGADPTLSGLVIRLRDAELHATQTEELGAAIAQARKAGKKVHVFSESYGTPELRLASYADDTLIQPGGPVSVTGIHMEELFLADTLAWIGVKASFVQVGDYKGASEMLANSKPSPAWDQNINQLLDGMYGNLRTTLKQRAVLGSDEKLDRAMKEAWLADAGDAVRLGLVDAQVDFSDIAAYLDRVYNSETTLTADLLESGETGLDMSNPFALLGKLSQKPEVHVRKPTIAVLHIEGTIVDGDSSAGGGLLGGGGSTGSRTIRGLIEDLADEDQVKGVVVRINSPGGSATASEVIWQGLRRLGAKKPVWISVGDMAASGGYYCAVAGGRIYVNPSSIVGSIGVVGGKVSMGELYKWAKVNVVSRSRGPMSGMFSSTEAWTPEEMSAVRAKMSQTYQQFTGHVAEGRKGIDLTATAEGRLFTGDRAVGLRMADRMGGLSAAVSDLAGEVRLDAYDVRHYPGPKSLPEYVQDMLGGFGVRAPGVASGSVVSPLIQAAQEVLGPAWPQVRQGLIGLLELRREPVILMGPSVLHVR